MYTFFRALMMKNTTTAMATAAAAAAIPAIAPVGKPSLFPLFCKLGSRSIISIDSLWEKYSDNVNIWVFENIFDSENLLEFVAGSKFSDCEKEFDCVNLFDWVNLFDSVKTEVSVIW